MGLLDFAGQLTQAALNNRAQKKQNAFNASQASLNRQFQAQEAEIARDWQEQQYNKYSSPQAMVTQYQDAGLNPALMYGNNLQSSTGSSPMPSGDSASGSALGVSGATGNIIDSIASLAQLKANIDNVKADTKVKLANADLTSAEQAYKESLKNVTDAQVNVVNQQFSKLAAETRNEEYKHNLLTLEKELKELQRNQDLDEARFFKKYGFYPNDSLQTAILKMAEKKGEKFKDNIARALRMRLPETTASIPLLNEWVKSRGF